MKNIALIACLLIRSLGLQSADKKSAGQQKNYGAIEITGDQPVPVYVQKTSYTCTRRFVAFALCTAALRAVTHTGINRPGYECQSIVITGCSPCQSIHLPCMDLYGSDSPVTQHIQSLCPTAQLHATPQQCAKPCQQSNGLTPLSACARREEKPGSPRKRNQTSSTVLKKIMADITHHSSPTDS